MPDETLPAVVGAGSYAVLRLITSRLMAANHSALLALVLAVVAAAVATAIVYAAIGMSAFAVFGGLAVAAVVDFARLPAVRE